MYSVRLRVVVQDIYIMWSVDPNTIGVQILLQRLASRNCSVGGLQIAYLSVIFFRLRSQVLSGWPREAVNIIQSEDSSIFAENYVI